MVLDHPEHQFLYDTARQQIEKTYGWLLEIGCFTGTTAKCIAQAISDSKKSRYLVCIDPFYGHYDSGLQKIMQEKEYGESTWVEFNKTLGDLISHVIPIAAPTKRVAELLYDIDTFCFAFIDGDHSEAGVLEDLTLAYNVVLPYGDGKILYHDAQWESIANTVTEFCNKYHLAQSIECGGAIGVIYR